MLRSIILAGFSLLYGLVSTCAGASEVIQWEYLKVVNDRKQLGIDNLNKLGQQCWELVACPVDDMQEARAVYFPEVSFRPNAYAVARYCIFKRPNPRQVGKEAFCPIAEDLGD